MSAVSRPPDRSDVWRSPHLPNTLLLRADFRRQRFDPHLHEEYAIGVIDAGCQAFTYDRGRRLDMPGGSLVREAARDAFGPGVVPTFHKPVVQDKRLFASIERLHGLGIDTSACACEVQTLLLAMVTLAFVGHAGYPEPKVGRRDGPALARVRDAIHAIGDAGVSLADLGALADMNRFRLLRQFRAEYGLSPHAYLRLARVERAKQAILGGTKLADAAHGAGFADHAHMTRAFRRSVGFTPGDLARRSH